MEASAQQGKTWKEMHKVKKKETIYGIAKEYGLTEEELRKANPEMLDPNYKLRKGDYIFIPYPAAKPAETVPVKQEDTSDIKTRAIRVGIMLPLHDVDGDGRRMVEFYRGILMPISVRHFWRKVPSSATSSSVRFTPSRWIISHSS